MKFVDTVKVYCRSGKGGPGCASMRREKFVEFGGPNGGDGGRGGNVYLVGTSDLNGLQELRFHPHQRAKNGMPGLGDQKNGKTGEDKVIKVPLGTVVTNFETEELICEILEEGEKFLLLKGGKGGLGNMHFKSSVNRAPRYAQPGEPEQELTVRMELKIMADVGLVGFPNAGKSTLISSVSNAKPKIADYPFTTLAPNLGVVPVKGFRSFVIADIPGIIEDAHLGVGLGDRFLKHIQRTSVLVFLIDCSEFAEREPLETFRILLHELKEYSEDLAQKRRVLLLTKIDAIHPELDIADMVHQFKEIGEELIPVSSVARNGLDRVVYRLSDIIDKERAKAKE